MSRPREGHLVWTGRFEEEPPNEVAEWLAWVTDALPEGVKAIILLDLPLEGGVEGQMVAHDFEDDEDILESWRRHLRAFQSKRVGPQDEPESPFERHPIDREMRP